MTTQRDQHVCACASCGSSPLAQFKTTLTRIEALIQQQQSRIQTLELAYHALLAAYCDVRAQARDHTSLVAAIQIVMSDVSAREETLKRHLQKHELYAHLRRSSNAAATTTTTATAASAVSVAPDHVMVTPTTRSG